MRQQRRHLQRRRDEELVRVLGVQREEERVALRQVVRVGDEDGPHRRVRQRAAGDARRDRRHHPEQRLGDEHAHDELRLQVGDLQRRNRLEQQRWSMQMPRSRIGCDRWH